MHIVNGIAYAGEPAPVIKVSGVRPLEEHRLWVRFNTEEVRMVDFKPLLEEPDFAALGGEKKFREVYVDYGVTVWLGW